MTAVQIADGSKNLTKLTGDSGLTSTWVTSKDNMHRHLLLLAKSALSTLHGILNRVCHLLNSALNLVHTDIGVEILKDILHRTLLRHIASDIIYLYPSGTCTATDIVGKDVLSSLIGQMTVTKGLILNLYLILEEARQLIIGLG